MKKSLLIWPVLALALASMACRALIPQVDLPTIPNVPAVEQDAPVAAATAAPVLQQPDVPVDIAQEETLLSVLYQQVNPAVVNITVFAEQQGSEVALGQGSGFVFDTEGHIVTNAHVVHGSDQIDVAFSDGRILIGELIGEDLSSDLAVVKVDALPEGVVPIPLGDINNVQVGDSVVAIGNPYGLEGTLTQGIVSAVGRTIPALNTFSIPQAIQTDAAINPGNSGGPLLNLQGEVIGVNAQIETGGTSTANSGVGFAIPVSIVAKVVPSLIETGSYEWTWIGVRGYSLTQTQVEAMNLPVDRGAYISEISGGPAEAAGLQGTTGTATVRGREVEVGGDVVVGIDGQPVNSFDDMLVYVALQTRPGQQVTLSILRDGSPMDVELTLEARPASLTEEVPTFTVP